MNFVLVCLFLDPECWEIMEPVLQQRNLAPMPQVLQVLEALLCFDAWTHKESYWNQADHVAEATAKKAIRTLLHMVQKTFPRNEGNGWKTVTFHEPLHLIDDMKRFGAAIGFMASRCENNHIFFAKQPGGQAQKRHATFVQQTARRLIDKIIIH